VNFLSVLQVKARVSFGPPVSSIDKTKDSKGQVWPIPLFRSVKMKKQTRARDMRTVGVDRSERTPENAQVESLAPPPSDEGATNVATIKGRKPRGWRAQDFTQDQADASGSIDRSESEPDVYPGAVRVGGSASEEDDTITNNDAGVVSQLPSPLFSPVVAELAVDTNEQLVATERERDELRQELERERRGRQTVPTIAATEAVAVKVPSERRLSSHRSWLWKVIAAGALIVVLGVGLGVGIPLASNRTDGDAPTVAPAFAQTESSSGALIPTRGPENTEAPIDEVYFSGFVTTNDPYFVAESAFGDLFSADLQILVHEDSDLANLLQKIQFHSSCSQLLLLNDRFGVLQLVQVVNDDQSIVSNFIPALLQIRVDIPAFPDDSVQLSRVVMISNRFGEFDLSEEVADIGFSNGDGFFSKEIPVEIDLSVQQRYTFDIEVKGMTTNGMEACIGNVFNSFSTSCPYRDIPSVAETLC